MIDTIKILMLALVLSALSLGCELGEKANQIKQMAEAAEERMKAGDTTGALGAFLGGGEAVQPVDFRTLKELLPERLDGLQREDAVGERSSMAGIATSQAEGTYRSEERNARITLSIVDFGSVRGITMMGFAWTMVDIDNESDRGYERTLEYEGYPAYAKYEQGNDWSRGEMSAIIVDRFAVTAKGNNVTDDELRAALEEIDLDRLENMKDAGVGEAPPENPELTEFTSQMRQQAQRSQEAGEEKDEPETMADVLSEMNEGRQIEPIDFRELRDMLPDELPGLPRTNAEGEKGGAAGVVQSSATGTYQAEDDRNKRITIKITDMGNLSGAMMMGGYSWLMLQLDKESDTGFERTTTYEGFPAYESYSTKDSRARGKIQTVVAKRFTVEVDGRGVEWEGIKEALDRVDVEGLEARKDEGVTPAG